MALFEDPVIQKKLENLFVSGFSQGSFGGVEGKNIQFLFSWPPETLDDSQYANPWTANHPNGLMSSTENISRLVNPIPLFSKNFTPSSNSIEDVYGDLILSARPLDSSLEMVSASERRVSPFHTLQENDKELAKNSIQKKINDKKDLLLSRERESLLELERKLSLDMAAKIISGNPASTIPESMKASLSDIRKKLSARHEKAVSRTYTARIRQHPKIKNKSTNLFLEESSNGDTVPLIVKVLHNANTLFGTTSVSSVNNPSTSYHPSYLTPYNFADKDMVKNWPVMDTVLKDSHQNNVKVSFSYTRADITRPWLLGYLLSMNGWAINGQSPGWLSNGNKDQNPGIFPLLPVSLLLCRNMKIIGSSTSYVVNGLQVIARCCQLTPKMAPD
ncbi:hypothetical protein GCM10028791_06860 [Echinicola sediminis]